MRTAGAVCRSDIVALDRNLEMPLAVEKMVDRLNAMATGDHDSPCSELVDPFGELSARAGGTCENLGLLQVGSHNRRERKEPRDERLDRVSLQKLRAGARNHDGVDDEGNAASVEIVGDRVDQLTR